MNELLPVLKAMGNGGLGSAIAIVLAWFFFKDREQDRKDRIIENQVNRDEREAHQKCMTDMSTEFARATIAMVQQCTQRSRG